MLCRATYLVVVEACMAASEWTSPGASPSSQDEDSE